MAFVLPFHEARRWGRRRVSMAPWESAMFGIWMDIPVSFCRMPTVHTHTHVTPCSADLGAGKCIFGYIYCALSLDGYWPPALEVR